MTQIVKDYSSWRPWVVGDYDYPRWVPYDGYYPLREEGWLMEVKTHEGHGKNLHGIKLRPGDVGELNSDGESRVYPAGSPEAEVWKFAHQGVPAVLAVDPKPEPDDDAEEPKNDVVDEPTMTDIDATNLSVTFTETVKTDSTPVEKEEPKP